MSLPATNTTLDVDSLLKELTLDEKVELLAGQGAFRTTGLPHRGIPSLVVWRICTPILIDDG
jgi:beta-glucosidase